MGAEEEQVMDTHSIDNDSIAPDEEERRYLEAARDPDAVVTRFSKGPQRLGLWSVVCIILNRTIGTGIFRSPSTVIRGTQSVGVTLLLWLVGAITGICGTIVFVEFGISTPRYLIDGIKEAVPRNGGELNYLQYIVQRPKHFATCVFGIAFIILGNMAGNAIFFGELVLTAANKEATPAATRGIAIAVTTFACLIHGIWRRGGIYLNNIFAVVKVAVLLMVVVLGFAALGNRFEKDGVVQNFAEKNLAANVAFANAPKVTYGYVESFLAVIFAYGGYQQANYVLSEIDQPRKTLKLGAPVAVGIIVVLYMLVNLAYMIAVSREDQLTSDKDVSLQFFINTLGEEVAARVLAAFMAISSLGNIIVMTFTAARVKQEIAKEGVIPFPKFFGESTDLAGRLLKLFRGRSASEAASKPTATDPTPAGALFLHWIFTLLLIFATWGVEDATDAYGILISIYSYTMDAFFFFVVAAGLLFLRLRPGHKSWRSKSSFPHVLSIVSATVLAVAMLFPLIAAWLPPSATTSDSAVDRAVLDDLLPGYPWFCTPTAGWSLLGFGVLYWLWFRFLLPRVGFRKGKELVVEREPFFHREHGYHVQWHEIVRFNWVIRKTSGYD